jgi:hypothetical protein
MAKTRTTPNDSPHRLGGDWTDAKLDVLARYLKSYTTALEGKPTPEQPFRKAYIDAFAGTGTREADRPRGAVPHAPTPVRTLCRRSSCRDSLLHEAQTPTRHRHRDTP